MPLLHRWPPRHASDASRSWRGGSHPSAGLAGRLRAALIARHSAPPDPTIAAGRLILTGSANVLLVRRLAESLAGRIGLPRLHPLSRCELKRHPPRFVDATWPTSPRSSD